MSPTANTFLPGLHYLSRGPCVRHSILPRLSTPNANHKTQESSRLHRMLPFEKMEKMTGRLKQTPVNLDSGGRNQAPSRMVRSGATSAHEPGRAEPRQAELSKPGWAETTRHRETSRAGGAEPSRAGPSHVGCLLPFFARRSTKITKNN